MKAEELRRKLKELKDSDEMFLGRCMVLANKKLAKRNHKNTIKREGGKVNTSPGLHSVAASE